MNKKITRILIIAISFIILISIKSYGAVAITKGTSVFTDRSISDFYDMCKEMKDVGQGLEGTTVDPHMATNKEWATVSYFSNSNYGTATVGKNTGIEVTIDEATYQSTNGNATGVMDWGKTITMTAGILSQYTDIQETDTVYTNGKSIIENATNSQYVDIVDQVDYNSIARNGWYNSQYRMENSLSYPYSVRFGLFGFNVGIGQGTNYYGYNSTTGAPNANATFRPIIFN